MRRKLIKLISVMIVPVMLWQNTLWAQPDARVYLRALAFDQRRPGAQSFRRTAISLSDRRYFINQVPLNAEFGVAVTDLRTQVLPIRIGINLNRFAKIHRFTMDLLRKRMRRESVPLMPAADAQQRGLLIRAISEIKAPQKVAFLTLAQQIGDAQLGHMQRIVNGFFEEEELRVVTSTPVDSMNRARGTPTQSRLIDLGYMMSIYVLRLLMDRTFLDQGAEMLRAETARWQTSYVREHFVPMQFAIATHLLKEGTSNIVVPEEEVGRVVGVVKSARLRMTRVGFEEAQGRWAKDSRVWLPHIDGEPYYYLTPEMIALPGIAVHRIFDPKLREIVKVSISEEGAVCAGVANGIPFMAFADTVDLREIREFEHIVKEEFPAYRNMRIFIIPSGFVTLKHGDAVYLIDNQHVDTVVGFLEKRFMQSGQDTMLFDPRYYAEIQSNKGFRSFADFLAAQGVRVVQVDTNETHFNPANFIKAPGDMRIFNYCPETIAALGLREGTYQMIPSEAAAVKALPCMGGSVGCLGTTIEITDQNRSRFSELPAAPQPIREADKIRGMVLEMLPHSPPQNMGIADYNGFREEVIRRALLVEGGFNTEAALEGFVRGQFNALMEAGRAGREGEPSNEETAALLSAI